MYFPLPGFPEENVNTVQHILKVVDYIYTIYHCTNISTSGPVAIQAKDIQRF
jgi:hypothetical protein